METATPLRHEDARALRRAIALLEHPGFASRLAHVVGIPIERGFAVLPRFVRDSVQLTTRTAINRAMRIALPGMHEDMDRKPSERKHLLLSGVSGAVGGLFGLPALTLEIPVATTLILRSIGDIARSEGESMGHPDARLACLEVFAYGGFSRKDDNAETGYYAVRAAMARTLSEASEFIVRRGVTGEGAPLLVRFASRVASRYGVTVSEKLAAQAVPIIGAVGGAAVNCVFMRHYQDMARGHFTIRRLERIYGAGRIRREYRKLHGG